MNGSIVQNGWAFWFALLAATILNGETLAAKITDQLKTDIGAMAAPPLLAMKVL